jgi:hypothetical protein
MAISMFIGPVKEHPVRPRFRTYRMKYLGCQNTPVIAKMERVAETMDSIEVIIGPN